ncbi:MAG: recombination protein RecR [Parcubacteria group bacterium]|nr:recombination protein RecR [Parcubacteria group bacterium]
MNSIEKLTQIFSNFPGVGPRQARRFVYYLLTRANNSLDELAQNIKELKNEVTICVDCKRFFQSNNKTNLCKICSDLTRDRSTLMLVQRDTDLESVEKNGSFKGIYFVLGGSVPILEKEPEKKIRIKELKIFVDKKIKEGLKEIILGVNWNPEGENTADYVKKYLKPTLEKHKIKTSHLGKGLSMGTELEYIDPDTLKNALQNRA